MSTGKPELTNWARSKLKYCMYLQIYNCLQHHPWVFEWSATAGYGCHWTPLRRTCIKNTLDGVCRSRSYCRACLCQYYRVGCHRGTLEHGQRHGSVLCATKASQPICSTSSPFEHRIDGSHWLLPSQASPMHPMRSSGFATKRCLGWNPRRVLLALTASHLKPIYESGCLAVDSESLFMAALTERKRL